jgi:hypothetical protein
MRATLGEDLAEQLGAAIRYQVMLGELRRAVDEARDADDALDLVEVADRCVQGAEQVDRDRARSLAPVAVAMSRPNWPTQALPSRFAMWPDRKTSLPLRTNGT